MPNKELKTSDEWLEIYQEEVGFNISIYTSEGWDRDNFKESWNEKITWKEFQNRLSKSTLLTNLGGTDDNTKFDKYLHGRN